MKTIKICTGKACTSNMSAYVLERAEKEISNRKSPIKIESSPCMGQCKKGPNLKIDEMLKNNVNPIEVAHIIKNS